MTEELKARIAQINAGTAPAGYKKTKVGIVPVEWEAIPFGELVDEYRTKTKTENEDVLLSCAINGIFLNSELFSHQRGASNIGYLKIDYGTLILSAQNLHLGNANVNLRFESGIVSPAYKTYKIRNCDVKYFSFWIKREETKRFFYNATTTGASQCRRNIEWDSLYEQKVVLPPLPEQQKIAEILTAQDRVIALIEKQIEALKQQKKAFQQKMFPKKGSKYPEIRFKGFTEPWATRKLGEIAECLDSMRVPLNAEERSKIQGDIPYYGAGSIQGYINQYLFDEELVLLLEDGDAFDDFKTKSIAQYVCGKSWVNNHSHVLRPKGNAYFLFTSLEHKDIRSATQLAGASRKKLVQEAMLKIKTSVPSVDEQNRIGEFFSFLDNLITLHQRKLELEQQKKKALMQLLLTGKVRVKT